MRVLVTGIGGFVGPVLARALEAGGHEVHGLVRDRDESARVGDAPAALHAADVTDRPAMTRLLESVQPDAVVHLAAMSFVPEAETEPEEAYRVNVGGTVTLLAALRAAAPRARLLQVGSADAYGDVRRAELPVTEEVPLRPLTVYGATKAGADLAAAQWARAYGLHVVRARPFNHTGPGQQPTFVCAAIARQIARMERGQQEAVLRVGNPDPVRDFSDVRDIARGYVALLERGRPGEAYNLCSGEGVSIAEVIALLRAQARLPLRVHSEPGLRRRVEVERVIGSHARATADTGWRPTIPLTETLATVLDDWRRRSD